MHDRKVVGIGLNKTGTKTLGACFRYLGFRNATFNKEAFELWRTGDYKKLMHWVTEYQSFEDFPWPLLYREIDAKFPGTKFILTRRKDPETWFASLCSHAQRTGPTVIRESVYGFAMPDQYMEEHISVYEGHLKSVREYFSKRPDDLLDVCWEEGDQWAELAGFLEVDQPEIPFPHRNKSGK